MRPIVRLSGFLVLLVLVATCAPAAGTPTAVEGSASHVAPTATVPMQQTSVSTQAATATPLATRTPLPPALEPTLPAATVTTPPRQIVLDSPADGATIRSPVLLSGYVSVSPFESTLVGRVYDASGQIVGEDAIMIAGEMGQPGTFSGQISFSAGRGGTGRVEVAEISPKDGSTVISVQVEVVFGAEPGIGVVEVPAAGARVTLPLRILACVGGPGEQVTAILRWQDGTELTNTATTLQGEDGHGLLIDTVNWLSEGQPPEPPTQLATLEIRDAAGVELARQVVTVLGPDDQDTQLVTYYLVLDLVAHPVQRRIPRTAKIGTAALEEMLWGPMPPNLAGFDTALPLPQEVLSYPGREPDWGPRVTLLKLTVVDGVATADFSKELRAYGGGSTRVLLIRQQIEETLKQFPTVREVVIAIEGESEGALEP